MGADIRNRVKFIHADVNPHTDIRGTGACRIEIRTVAYSSGVRIETKVKSASLG